MNWIINIRTKMAVLIMALVLIIGIAIVRAVAMLASIEERLVVLDDQTSAAFAANAVLASSDELMAEAISDVRLATEEEVLSQLGANVGDILSETSQTLSLLPIAPGGKLRLTSQLDLFGTRMERLIDVRRDVLAQSRRLDARLEELGKMAEGLDAAFAVLIAEEFALADASPTREGVVTRSAALMRLQSLSDLFRVRVSDLAGTDGEGRAQILTEVRARLGDLIRATAAIGESEAAAVAAEEMTGIYEAIGPSGEIANAILGDFEADLSLAAALSDVNEARRAADRLTAETAEAVGASIRERRRAVFEDEGQVRRFQASVLAGIVLGILLLVWLVTDRRIVRRIESLTREMQRVAGGDLDAPVKSEGADEIGQMADALAVFRLNAIELRRSNAELGNFAYAASHDLRSPLRAIRNLVDWTIEDSGGQLPPDIQSNLVMIRERADRLSRLLTDLLEYARAGSGEIAHEVVHLPGLVRDIADIADPDRRFQITFTGDRCITSAKTPLRTILLNLVSNSIKHHDQDQGRVEIHHESGDGTSVVAVSDDGPGVPEQYREKVFELFQTLRPSDEVEGSGMGLAMVRKLVTELGGKIELNSLQDDGRGTTFIIRLPVRDKVEDDEVQSEIGDEGMVA